ncbi:hypothetical protein G4G27_09440 [Sphingomonas sp. So64.6b]|uniref:hypothetical protein n=1 Tax=Sphingomonas sp. So64.6b TaxID=2997354 RepID=UPI001602F8AC|nr:hypothetical protein [Sphingomonas sp. So64.6b]QNA84183.1 hypothetical protein G4G27_09440 [Sphingomonas sp. So64.6b]
MKQRNIATIAAAWRRGNAWKARDTYERTLCMTARERPVRPSRRAAAQTATAWRAVVFAVLALFGWQSVVLQSHVHLAPKILERATDQHPVATQLMSGHHENGDPADCPICRDIDDAGQYLTPSSIAIDRHIVVPTWTSALLMLLVLDRQRSHSWQSRAPPTLPES